MNPAPLTRSGRARRRAATLVETLVVIAITAVIGGIVLSIASTIWKVVKSWQ